MNFAASARLAVGGPHARGLGWQPSSACRAASVSDGILSALSRHRQRSPVVALPKLDSVAFPFATRRQASPSRVMVDPRDAQLLGIRPVPVY